MRIEAHGISVDVPSGWEARVFRRGGGEPTLHAASFPLPADDGEFGSRATAAMPPGSMFISITEYRPGQGLVPGRGIFAPTGPPESLRRENFHPRTLLVARRGQEGLQRFFTTHGRPFCLYAVLDSRDVAITAGAGLAGPGPGALNELLGSLTVRPRRASG